MNIFSAIAFRWMTQDITVGKLTLVQVMAAIIWTSVEQDPCHNELIYNDWNKRIQCHFTGSGLNMAANFTCLIELLLAFSVDTVNFYFCTS